MMEFFVVAQSVWTSQNMLCKEELRNQDTVTVLDQTQFSDFSGVRTMIIYKYSDHEIAMI